MNYATKLYAGNYRIKDRPPRNDPKRPAILILTGLTDRLDNLHTHTQCVDYTIEHRHAWRDQSMLDP